eukprot:7214458-Lingulodinium_polyedra.AAC.1
MICDHQHAQGADARRVQLSTWQFAARVAQGCQAAIKKGNEGLLYFAYPLAERDRPDPEADWRKCPGCLGRVDKTDPSARSCGWRVQMACR